MINIRSPMPRATEAQFSYTKKLDLNDYYVENREQQIIHCQICKYDVPRGDVFEHTTSKRHKYNKLFVAILKNYSSNKDADFIVLNIDQLQCRYCDSLIINSYNNDLVINHLEDTTHIERKQNFMRKLDELSNNTVDIGVGPSDVNANLLQSLDSLIIHNKKYNQHKKRIRKTVTVNETVLSKEVEELIVAIEKFNLENKNDAICQNSFPQSSEFPIVYERETREKLPECIVMIEGPTCLCTICTMQVPKSTHNVTEHLNGKKHKMNVMNSIITKAESVMVDIMQNKLLTQSDKFSNYCGIVTDKRDNRDTNNIVENNVPQPSTSCANSTSKIQNEVSNRITIGENGTYICKTCIVEMPNTVHNINEHLNGKKHKEKKIEVEKFKQEILKLQNVNTSMPALVGNTKKNHNEITKYEDLQKFLESITRELYSLEITKIMPEYTISKVKNDTYMCTTCVLLMSNNEYYIRYHNGSKKHKNELEKLTQPVIQELKVGKKSNAKKKNVNFMCITCDVMLGNTENSLKDHYEGKRHRRVLQKHIKSTRKELVLLETSLSMERQY